MKKSLVLAMAMALGVTASAYAANPFSDVPAGHWAYDSISKLAAAGIIEGYGDDTFRGDRLMTRYEMAQIVAKALAKGANVDKLAAEFADELDALGVRVAALEKKSDNVKITGQVRYRYYRGKESKAVKHDLRSRLWFNGQVNDSWSYTAMIENVQNFDNNIGDETTKFQRAWVDGRIGGVKVTAGRFQNSVGGGVVFENRMDGVKASYGFGKVNAYAYYGKPAGGTAEYSKDAKTGDGKDGWKTPYRKMAGIGLAANFGKVAADVGYDVFGGYRAGNGWDTFVGKLNSPKKNQIWNIGLKAEIAKDVTLGGRYLRSNRMRTTNDSKNGYVIDLAYAGAKANKVGSWGLSARYMNVGSMIPMAYVDDNSPASIGTRISGSVKDGYAGRQGWKGFEVKANYTFAKNMIGTVAYYDWKGKTDNKKEKVFGGHLMFTF